MEDQESCACLNVIYSPEIINSKAKFEMWRCVSCGAKFVRDGTIALYHEKLDELLKKQRRYKRTFNLLADLVGSTHEGKNEMVFSEVFRDKKDKIIREFFDLVDGMEG
jgi:hypothetical protein